jgi:hypothetical protein
VEFANIIEIVAKKDNSSGRLLSFELKNIFEEVGK